MKRETHATWVICRFMYKCHFKKRLWQVKNKYPNLEFRITFGVRCFLRKIRKKAMIHSAEVLIVFLKEHSHKTRSVFGAKKLINRVRTLQCFYRASVQRTEAKIQVLNVKWRKMEENVLVQARLDKDKKASKSRIERSPESIPERDPMQEATERDPWFPTNIPRPIRRKVLKEFIKQHYKKVYLPQCQRIEQSRLRWLEDERKRRSLEMARMFIHSDSNDWVNEFGDDKLMLLCPFVRGPFMVHSLPEDQVDRLIKRGIDLTIQVLLCDLNQPNYPVVHT